MKVVALQRDSQKSAANRNVYELASRLGTTYYQRRSVPVCHDTDLVVQWGFKDTPGLMSAIVQNIPYVIIDLGYFDTARTSRFSISLNGFHGTGMRDPEVLDRPPRPHPIIQDWRDEGSRVYVIGQMPNDQSLRGQDIEAWMGRTAVEAAETWKLPVIKRPHPKMLNPWEPQPEPLSQMFEDAHVVVTWTSTTAVQSLLAGVPTVAMHRGSSAQQVCPRSLLRLKQPGRARWAHELAWREWDFGDPEELDELAEYIQYQYPRMIDAPLDSPRNKL